MVFLFLDSPPLGDITPFSLSPRWHRSSQTTRSWHLDELRQGETSIERAIVCSTDPQYAPLCAANP